ncbi:Appr-1-p processing domain protein [Burkholderia ambifaria IOP40-10]|uniref:Appr-1-p processing domain protein n=1 Tax=Burkholderia ambifaria IOP40-10 TaxID=396596 RepID=B1FBA1_9BURK|nr:macro domain-containing protein [Burkholderia ambifaria]EDT05183.1 Appr-1-p processing domain protein [Burkholderia ambifaria IOP40-10]
MKLILCAINVQLSDAWRVAFEDCEDVSIVRGDILEQSADAIVSPANSFGWMGGGIGRLYRNRFGSVLEHCVMRAITECRHCELPVGEAIAVPTRDPAIPNLIVAPTVRMPSDVSASNHAYLALAAALRTAKFHRFASVLSPGLCTGGGRMHPVQAAYQMRQAYIDSIAELPHGEQGQPSAAIGQPVIC